MRILLVDDSALVRGILRQVLEEAGHQIVGQASNGQRGVELNRELTPDLVIMDFNMPVMDGLAATRAIMADQPVPILIFSTEGRIGFEAVAAGAVEFLTKPQISELNDGVFLKLFLERIRNVAQAKPRGGVTPVRTPWMGAPGGSSPVIVMGASTGGPQAVHQILEALPAGFPLAIALVQHLEAGFDRSYAQWLQESCALPIRLAGPQEGPQPGTVLIAPVGSHLRCEGAGFVLWDGPAVLNQKPAVDVLFKSAAEVWGARAIGVLLTGMGSDGADGCVALRRAGGLTLVQDEASSAIYGMPKVAADRGGASEILSLDAIAPRLIQLAASR